MDVVQKEKLIQNMTDNLPTLRKKLNLSQEELSELIGVYCMRAKINQTPL